MLEQVNGSGKRVRVLIEFCAGTDPNPIAVYLPGDENKSCASLKAEIANIDKQIIRKQAQKSKQEGENILWFITGWLLIVPWFFMDLKENEKSEINALQARKDALLVLKNILKIFGINPLTFWI